MRYGHCYPRCDAGGLGRRALWRPHAGPWDDGSTRRARHRALGSFDAASAVSTKDRSRHSALGDSMPSARHHTVLLFAMLAVTSCRPAAPLPPPPPPVAAEEEARQAIAKEQAL